MQLTASAANTYSGQISFTNNDSDENPFNFSITGVVTAPLAPEVAVTGNGQNIADGDTSPTTGDWTNFGSTTVGTPVSRTFRVTNSGPAAMTTGSLSVPAGYSITEGLSSSIGANGGYDDFTVQLTASAANTYSGQISFTNNDSDENPFNFSITGVVTAPLAPEVAVTGNGQNIADGDTSPTTGDWTNFGSTTVGTPVSRTFRVTNSGPAALTTGSLSVPAGYSITEGLSSSIGANGGYDDFTVQLTASAANTYSGQISFTNNDSDENPFNFSITGVVTAPPGSLVVDTLLDETTPGDGLTSLREAIMAANANPGPDTISFAPGLTGTISLMMGELAIWNSVTIQGPGAPSLTINANHSSRIFNIDDGNDGVNSDVVIDGLTLTGGMASGTGSQSFGGAVFSKESLTIYGSDIVGNSADSGGGVWVATYTGGTTTIHNSTISGNTANYYGGGIEASVSGGSVTLENSTIFGNTANYLGGGMDVGTSGGNMTIQNSTISGNTANLVGGGGIWIWGYTYGGTTTIRNSTISGNTTGGNGGGIFSYYGMAATVESTIIALNSNTGNTGPNIAGVGTVVARYSLIADNTGGTAALIDNGHNLIGSGVAPIDPKLGPLANNGGPTMTRALLPGSPAIDTGSNPAGLMTDQRGEGFPRTLGNQTDIGAYETMPDTNPPTPNPSTWATAPHATGTTSISMTATTASDPGGNGVQYYFHCLTTGGHDSAWQASATYQDTGLSPNTLYSYQVRTRDQSANQNMGSYSTTASATTQQVVDTNPPTPNPSTWATAPHATGTTSISMTATTASDPGGNGVQYYFHCLTTGGHDSAWQASATYQDTGLSPNTLYSYQVRTRDQSANQNMGSYSTTASATTQQVVDTNPPTPNPSTWATAPHATGTTSISMTATTASDPGGNGVQYYFHCLTTGGHDSAWQAQRDVPGHGTFAEHPV